jgi:hypothetical protein
MNYEFIINCCIRFLKKYKKEILWWTLFIRFCPTIDFNQFAYRREDYQAELDKSNNKFTESKEE